MYVRRLKLYMPAQNLESSHRGSSSVLTYSRDLLNHQNRAWCALQVLNPQMSILTK